MSTLKPAETRIIARLLRMESGYVLNFSNRTFAEFFSVEMDVDIYNEVWAGGGTSKANLLRTYLQIADDGRAAKLLRTLLDYMETTGLADFQAMSGDRERVLVIAQRLENSAGLLRTDAIDRFHPDDTLEELIKAIDRDVNADKPEVALDRLHTYCMKKFAHLIATYRPSVTVLSATLNGRAGQYLNELKREAKGPRPVSFEIMGATVRIFELFNSIRNDHSLAHDNTLLDKAEARFIFEAICNLLRFVKATEGQRFGE